MNHDQCMGKKNKTDGDVAEILRKGHSHQLIQISGRLPTTEAKQLSLTEDS